MPFFLALARGGNIATAAKLSDTNRTTVKRRIDAVEQLMQGRLFEANEGNYTLTPLGRELLIVVESAEAEFQQVNEILNIQADTSSLIAGTIRLALSSHLLETMTHIICAFCEDYPEVKLELLTSNSYVDIERREVDIAFRIDGNKPQFPLVGENIAPLMNALYCKAGTFRSDMGYVAKVGETNVPASARTYLPHSKLVLSVDGVLSHRALIASGLGAGILPCFLCDDDPRLERISTIEPGGGRNLWLLTHATIRNSPRIDLLIRYIKKNW